MRLPDVEVCPDHVSPFHAFAEAYFARQPVAVWKASRGFGGKTFTLSLLGLVEALTLNADVTLLGGSGEQSRRVHEYMDLWSGAVWHDYEGEPTQRETRLSGGGRIRALMASTRSARGPHPQRQRLDEADEMALKVFEAASGQTMSRPGIPKQTVISSTHQYVSGTMTIILERALERQWPVYQWCWRETVEPHGWLPQDEVESKQREVSQRMWAVEYDLGEPTAEGVVFPEFNQANITDVAEAPDQERGFEIAADDGYENPRAFLFIQKTDTRIFIFDELYHRHHLAEVCVREAVERSGEYFGWQERPDDAPEDWMPAPQKRPELCVGGAESKDMQGQFRKADIPYRWRAYKVVEAVKHLRQFIADGQGYRTIQVHPRCVNLIRELTRDYHYPDGATGKGDEEPADENNHAVEALYRWAWSRARR